MSSITGYPSAASPLPGHCAGFSGLLLKETVSTKEMSHMTQSQSRSKSPASWHPGIPEREGLWIFTRLRDFIDNIANTSPARLALTAFGMVILVFTALLSLPVSSATGEFTPLHQALFTAVSAVCVTGLTVVSTAVHWSFFGQLVDPGRHLRGRPGHPDPGLAAGPHGEQEAGCPRQADRPGGHERRPPRRGGYPAADRHRDVRGDRGRAGAGADPAVPDAGRKLRPVGLARCVLRDFCVQQRRFHPALGRHRPLRDRSVDPRPADARRLPRQPRASRW